MMGYAEAQKAYKLYDLEHQKMVTSVQVEFRENEFPGVRTPIDEYLVTHDDDDDDDEELTQGEPVDTKPTSTPVTTSQPRMAPPSHFKPGKRVTSTPTPRGMSTQAHFYPDSIVDGAVGGRPLSALTPPATSRRDTMMTMDEFNSPPSDYRGMALRDRNKIRVPARFDGESARRSNTKQVANVIRDLDAATGRDRANAATEVELGATMTVDGVEYACSALPTMDDIPQSHHEAMRSPDRAEWAKAEELELKQLRDAGTWKLVDLPTGRKSIGSRWTYAKKTNSAGEVIRHKARLVCKGYSQVEGVDYTDTYSPVVKMGTIRACAAFVVSKDYVIVQADADTAFVQAKMEEGVLLYVDQPPGHGDGTSRVMLLIKALYGLKQAALAWFEHCRKILMSISFHPSAYDPCLYMRESEGDLEMLSTYVDDFLVMTKTTAAAEKILDQLESKIKLKRQGKAAYFLGIKIDYQDKVLTMNQAAYARKVLDRFGMTDCHGYATPEVDDREDLWHDDQQPSTDQLTYRSITGSLMYLMVCTRPDIAHAVQRLSRHLHDPREPHMVGAKRILRYIKSTLDHGLIFRASNCELVGYSDASWANRDGRRSTTGFICFVSGGAVSWKSARQRVVALSTCEAEYIALVEMAKEVVWLRGLLQEMGVDQQVPTITWCDNKSAIATAEGSGVSERSKHMDVRLHYVRQLIRGKAIDVRHVRTTDQLADILTKVSTRDAISKFKTAAMTVGTPSETSRNVPKTGQLEAASPSRPT
ncbi:hypothetical protein AaE_015000 [Aphanomyces astaci]|uniref:Uncharacterized protein n=1 Tax=Aphanomyces astaci TaxID=112090 RepID=A0A6A4Z536_APHAT|nr:hypothetical protein AaE_015000 [Aphanomyces astaci]